MGCPLHNPSPFTLKFGSFLTIKFDYFFKTIKNFSIKSEGLRRGQLVSYTE